tara:strand:- start:10952 stop:12076 length:1125 start_codon:yes stop_codon:yes gene_type:complete
MKKLKIAIVMPTHFDIHSSLNNFLKTYEYLIHHFNVEVTLFTDKKNDIRYNKFKIRKIKGFDYKTIFEKILFLLGIPRYYYPGLENHLKFFDVITSNNPEFYLFAYQSYLASKKYKIRLVLRTSQTVDGFFLFKLMKYFIVPIVKKSYDYSKFSIFTNPQAEDRCLRLGLLKNSKKSIVTGHPTDIELFRPIGVKKSDKKILLSVGGLYKIKGHHIIIKSLKKIIDGGFTNIELWIVGEGYYKGSLIDLATNLGVRDKVKFLGKKGHQELSLIYNKSDLFVLANYQEITPAVNEALACGKPVVVMKCGGYKFVLPSGNGLITKKFDVEDMSDKILWVLNNKKEVQEMTSRGRKYIVENFSIPIIAEKLYKAYTE